MALLSRWYLVGLLVGVAVAALPVALGAVLMYVGNALEACPGDLGCSWLFIVGVLMAPFGGACGAISAALVARRLNSVGGLTPAQRLRSSFGAGVLALFPAGFLCMLSIAAVSATH